MDGSLLFVNKSQSSGLLTRSKAREKSKIFSHVQSRRRRGEAGRRAQPWSEVTFSAIESGRQVTPEAGPSQEESEGTTARQIKKPLDRLLHLYPTDNAFDPFHCTVAGYDVGTHAMLQFTFSSAAKTTFLAEALAPPEVSSKRSYMRHDEVIGRRLKRCVEDEILMYSTLAYGSSCLGWMQGVVNAGRPPEYFLDKAIRALRKRLSQPDYHTDTWLPVSIYALAITEMWNGILDMWERCPERYAMMLHSNKSGPAAARVHLKALLHVVEKAGGWNRLDPYVLESSILADKYLAIYEMKTPIIPLTWDPGALPQGDVTRFETREKTFPHLSESLWPLIRNDEVMVLLRDIVQFLRIAQVLWLAPAIGREEETWLFFRLQTMEHRLMSMVCHRGLESFDRCICLTTLVFLCNITPYDGAQVGAKVLIRHLRATLIEAMFWEDRFGEELRLWCVCTGAMTTRSSPDRDWFLAMVSRYCYTLPMEPTDKDFVEVLERFLFLPIEQKGQLKDMLCNLP